MYPNEHYTVGDYLAAGSSSTPAATKSDTTKPPVETQDSPSSEHIHDAVEPGDIDTGDE